MDLRLRISRGSEALGNYSFATRRRRTVKLGSLDSAGVSLPGLRRVEAVIRLEQGRAEIIDLGGRMQIQGRPAQRARLLPGTVLSFGDLRVWVEDPAGRDPAGSPARAAEGSPGVPVVQAVVSSSAPPAATLSRGSRITAEKLGLPAVEGQPHPSLPPEPPVSVARHVLELRVYWGDTLLDLRHVQPPGAITIGDGKGADLLLTRDSLPRDVFPLVRWHRNRWLLSVTDGMTGEVESHGRLASLASWRRQAFYDTELDDVLNVPLDVRARAVVHLSGMTFALRCVPPAVFKPGKGGAWSELPFLNTILASAWIHLMALMVLVLSPTPPAALPEEELKPLIMVLDRLSASPPTATPARAPRAPRPPPRRASVQSRRGDRNRGLRGLGRGERLGDGGRRAELSTLLRDAGSLLGDAPSGLAGALARHIRRARPATAPAGLILGGRATLHADPARVLRPLGAIATGGLLLGHPPAQPERRRASSTAIALDAPQLRSALPREAVAKVIAENRQQIRYCFERELQRDQELAGRVVVHFTIGGDGRVQLAEIRESTAGFDAVNRCILVAARRWRFPEPQAGGIVEVTYPLIFQAQ